MDNQLIIYTVSFKGRSDLSSLIADNYTVDGHISNISNVLGKEPTSHKIFIQENNDKYIQYDESNIYKDDNKIVEDYHPIEFINTFYYNIFTAKAKRVIYDLHQVHRVHLIEDTIDRISDNNRTVAKYCSDPNHKIIFGPEDVVHLWTFDEGDDDSVNILLSMNDITRSLSLKFEIYSRNLNTYNEKIMDLMKKYSVKLLKLN